MPKMGLQDVLTKFTMLSGSEIQITPEFTMTLCPNLLSIVKRGTSPVLVGCGLDFFWAAGVEHKGRKLPFKPQLWAATICMTEENEGRGIE